MVKVFNPCSVKRLRIAGIKKVEIESGYIRWGYENFWIQLEGRSIQIAVWLQKFYLNASP
jgi:hypothetical protein